MKPVVSVSSLLVTALCPVSGAFAYAHVLCRLHWSARNHAVALAYACSHSSPKATSSEQHARCPSLPPLPPPTRANHSNPQHAKELDKPAGWLWTHLGDLWSSPWLSSWIEALKKAKKKQIDQNIGPPRFSLKPPPSPACTHCCERTAVVSSAPLPASPSVCHSVQGKTGFHLQ